MSGTIEFEDDDLIAGEYVLGLLDPAEALALEAEAERRIELNQAISAWQSRLAPLLGLIEPAAPPADLWRRIEAGSFGEAARKEEAPKFWDRLVVWRGLAAVCAVAAVVAGIAILRPPAPPTPVAALLPPGQHAAVVVVSALSDGRFALHPVGVAAAPSGHDWQLWSLPDGAKTPVSLGLMSGNGVILAANQVPHGQSQIMVSLEPQGGSPTGLPTGPVIWQTVIRN